MSREEIAAFLASLKKLRDGLDDFNGRGQCGASGHSVPVRRDSLNRELAC